MLSSSIPSSDDTSQKVIIYLGIPILIAGVIGGLLNIIVFSSIRRFRRNSSIFYLTIMSICNIGQLITGLLFRIMINGFNIDWTQSSVFYCKFRWYCLNVCLLISLTCMCFATINQFLTTYPSCRWQNWSQIKIAHIVTAISIFIWLIYEIPCLIYNNLVVLSSSGKVKCIVTNMIFYQYHSYASLWLFGGFLPILINCLFGFLAYLNIQRSSQRTLPLIRRELDRQLTVIVLIQSIYSFITMVPSLIVTIFIVDTMIIKDRLMDPRLQLVTILMICLYYINLAVSIKMSNR